MLVLACGWAEIHMELLTILLGFLISAGLTALIIPRIILISYKKRLFDETGGRKVHTGAVPRLGGVAFTPSVIITVALLAGLEAAVAPGGSFAGRGDVSLALCLSAITMLYLEGVADDLVGVGYKAKFGMQILSAAIVAASGIWMNDLHGLFSLYAISPWAGYPLTVVLLVFVINAVNLIDGIDGLASGLSSLALFFLGCLFASRGDTLWAVLAFTTLGTLVPFFCYNVFGRPGGGRKIFMGDCGSQTIGLLLGLLCVRFCMTGECAPTAVATPNPLAVVFSLLMVPCLDVLRVMLGRLRRGKNPFLPDKTHIHHKFLALGMSHRTALVVILSIAAFFALLNLGLLPLLDINFVLLADILLWTAMNIWLSRLIRARQARGEGQEDIQAEETNTK